MYIKSTVHIQLLFVLAGVFGVRIRQDHVETSQLTFLYDPHSHFLVAHNSVACFLALLLGHERDMIHTDRGIQQLEIQMMFEWIGKVPEVPVYRTDHNIPTAVLKMCSRQLIYYLDRTGQITACVYEEYSLLTVKLSTGDISLVYSDSKFHIRSSKMGAGRNGGSGFYLTFGKAFILCFLAILIAVGVGLIVHFSENRKFECVLPEIRSGDDTGQLHEQSTRRTTQDHSYKLFYFDWRGRGELSRMMFTAAGQSFVDRRIDFFKEWPGIKYTMPQYVVPVLEVDGRTNITQSMAITRYLARKFDLYGKNAQEMALVDQIIETVVDIFSGVLKFQETPNATERARVKAEFYKENCPKYLQFLENLVAEGGRDNFAVGDGLTLADLALHVYIEHTEAHVAPSDRPLLNNYTRLAENRRNTERIPKIRDYLANRPHTDL
ncbi:uncharacterized protein LOC127879101 isoform X1 [Dreissena polymorpha]|uniref:uncharacterized protein LOC127879101 isoform X1 n=1 Tax=Dreissena polymorpha TaxID=45954 RepID=UPI002264DAFB|nr:uncharacterized protein LOC127879101 isoform X1 [Dreissena polymorpha]